MKAWMILCFLAALAATTDLTALNGKKPLVPICPRKKSLLSPISTSGKGFPEKAINIALRKNPTVSKELSKRKAANSKGKLYSPAPGSAALYKKSSKFRPCPYRLYRVYMAYRCWIVWPKIRTARCQKRRCRLVLPWPIQRKGVCRPRNYVTYRHVLLACRRGVRWVFRWTRVTVALSCGCWPCWYKPVPVPLR